MALKPVKPTTSSGASTPTLVVKLKPVKVNSVPSTSPQLFWPQFKVPQPGCCITSKAVPRVVVAVKPGNSIIVFAPPQPSNPHVSAPQPVSLNAVTVPTDVVADKPVKVIVTPSWLPQEFWPHCKSPQLSADSVFAAPPIPEWRAQ